MEQIIKASERPELTVITVCYNAAQSIAATLESVTGQTARDRMEVIVIDGASTDGTAEIVRGFGDRIDTFVSEPDKGIYNAMNKGLRLARGRYVNFMNAGDRFFNERVVEEVLDEIAGMSGWPDVVYGATVRIGRDGCTVDKPRTDVLPDAIGGCHQSILTATDAIREKGFDESYRIVADFEMMRRLWLGGARFATTEKIIAVYDAVEGVSSVASTEMKRYRERCRILGQRCTRAGFYIKKWRVLAGKWRRKMSGKIVLRKLEEIRQN